MRPGDLKFYLRGRINRTLSRALNARRAPAPLVPAASFDDVVGGATTPRALARLLEGRDNDARQAALARYLGERQIPFTTHRFETFEGRGENFAVEVGAGDRVLVLIAHHDAVPGSPGANDNAAAVGILLHLVTRVAPVIAPSLRVRFLFPACEELGYLGARAYVRDVAPAGVVGVLSLELCGIGDSLVVWDASAETPFLRSVGGALGDLGLRRDEGWHQVGRIPVFGSDHRAFAAAGIPAYGFTIVPAREADALRAFVLNPVRSALMHVVRRPVPFDTYHTPRDGGATLEEPALDRVARALEAIIASIR
ncbi:MAG TPA: M28 family peptidase [Methylomirabilota bacterium]|nr:M28 family peptidase [Methylomirabilota bacterium]